MSARLCIDIESKSRSNIEIKVRNSWKIVSVNARPVKAGVYLNDDDYELVLKTSDGTTIYINMNTTMLLALYGMIHYILDQMPSFYRFYTLTEIPKVIE